MCRRLSKSEPARAQSRFGASSDFPNATAFAVTQRKRGPTPNQERWITPPNPPTTSKQNGRSAGANRSRFSACTTIAVGSGPNVRAMPQPEQAELGSAAAEANGERSDRRRQTAGAMVSWLGAGFSDRRPAPMQAAHCQAPTRRGSPKASAVASAGILSGGAGVWPLAAAVGIEAHSHTHSLAGPSATRLFVCSSSLRALARTNSSG